MVYRFDQQNSIGIQGEKEIRDWFKRRGIKTYDIPLSTNKLGIDFFTRTRSGRKILYEVKSDTQTAATGNVFIEAVSNDQTSKLGLLHTSKADVLLYLIPDLSQVLICPLPELRQFILENGPFPVRVCRNKTYNSKGYLVRLDNLTKNFKTEEIY